MAVHVTKTVKIDASISSLGQFDRVEVTNSQIKIEFDAKLGIITLRAAHSSSIEFDSNDLIDALKELKVL